MNNKMVHMVTFLLLVAGGLNGLLMAGLGMDVIGMLGASVAKIVYILIGLSAVMELITHKKRCTMCGS